MRFLRHLSIEIAVKRVAILLLGVGWVLVLHFTASTSQSDPFESRLFWPSFIGLPTLAGLGAYLSFEDSPAAWAVGLLGPAVIWVGVQGTVLHNPEEGASLWLAGEMTLIILGTIVGIVVGLIREQRKAPTP